MVVKKAEVLPALLFAFIFVPISYAWFFWAVGNLLDAVWQIICSFFIPLFWLRGKSRQLVYGPSPRKLFNILRGKPILLLTSHNDEADLLLQVGSAPARLYKEFVASRFSIIGRLLKVIFLRPIVLGVFLKVIEMFLEVLSLGFPIWKALIQDFEVGPPDVQPYYPDNLLVHERLNVLPKAPVQEMITNNLPRHESSLNDENASPLSLRFSLQEVTEELTRQIQLRHSTYYGTDKLTAIRRQLPDEKYKYL